MTQNFTQLLLIAEMIYVLVIIIKFRTKSVGISDGAKNSPNVIGKFGRFDDSGCSCVLDFESGYHVFAGLRNFSKIPSSKTDFRKLKSIPRTQNLGNSDGATVKDCPILDGPDARRP